MSLVTNQNEQFTVVGSTPSTVLLPSHSLRDDRAANAEAFVSVRTKAAPVFGVMSWV